LWCVVGLGNPGRRYSGTRHNVGFMVVEDLAGRLGVRLKERLKYSVAKGSVEDVPVLLAEPLTFMNRSGLAVSEITRRYGLAPEHIIVVHDDMDMPVGRLKIKAGGSAGGHRGVESIIEHIGTGDFIRIKVGVGREEGLSATEHVLSGFREEEVPAVQDALKRASEAAIAIILEGAGAAMNRFNTKPASPPVP
jgi:PTH1 family peptidyl-tRNA hydrolase